MTDILFNRGSTFAYSANIPKELVDGYFKDWEVTSQIRKKDTDTDAGLIASLQCIWKDSQKTRTLYLLHPVTDNWPLGEAEIDVVFTSPKQFRARSKKVSVLIERGITR